MEAAMLVAGLLIAQQVAGRALRDALFLSAYSVTALPGMMLVSALVAVCGSLAFAAAMARRGPVAVLTELETPAGEADAQLDHVFALLSAVGEREPLRASRWALRGEDQRLRGTALEYLEQVLPDTVREPLLRLLGPARVSGPARQLDEIEEELRLSAASPPRALIARRPRSQS